MIPLTDFERVMGFMGINLIVLLILMAFGFYVMMYGVSKLSARKNATLSSLIWIVGALVVSESLTRASKAFMTFTVPVSINLPSPIIRSWVGTTAVLIAAGLLFLLKSKALRYYAYAEIFFGIVVTSRTMSAMHDEVSPSDLLLIGTALYLLIRGMDNFKTDYLNRSNATSSVPQ